MRTYRSNERVIRYVKLIRLQVSEVVLGISKSFRKGGKQNRLGGGCERLRREEERGGGGRSGERERPFWRGRRRLLIKKRTELFWCLWRVPK